MREVKSQLRPIANLAHHRLRTVSQRLELRLTLGSDAALTRLRLRPATAAPRHLLPPVAAVRECQPLIASEPSPHPEATIAKRFIAIPSAHREREALVSPWPRF